MRCKTFADFLKKLGLKRFEIDYNVFVLQNQQFFLIIYIDNWLFFGFNKSYLINIQN